MALRAMCVQWILACAALIGFWWGVQALNAVPKAGFGEGGPGGFELAVIDRVEEGLAVLLVGEKEEERVWPLADLPSGARPGSWLRVRWENGQLLEARLAPEETELARKRIQDKLDQLRRRGRRLD